jgi:hypothetical protein
LLAGVIVLAVAAAAVWEMVVGAKWIIDLWERPVSGNEPCDAACLRRQQYSRRFSPETA